MSFYVDIDDKRYHLANASGHVLSLEGNKERFEQAVKKGAFAVTDKTVERVPENLTAREIQVFLGLKAPEDPSEHKIKKVSRGPVASRTIVNKDQDA